MKKHNIWTKKFWKAAGERAIRTFAQTFVATVGTTAILSEVAWKVVFSSSALAAIMSIATSIGFGIPEAEGEE